jgi:macrolide transport system ATP-binding/permease protein
VHPLRRFLLRLRNAIHPGREEPDLARELASHLGLLEDEYQRRGMSADDARAAARRAFGSAMHAKDLHRDARSFTWIDDARRDGLYAIRTLRRTPGFTALAVLTLALGIGATTAIFTLIDGVLLQSLPVRDARGLVLLGDARGSGTAIGLQGGSFTLFSYDLYRRLRDERIFDGLCAVQSSKSRVSVRRPGVNDTEPAFARLVSANYFDVLGTRAALGRVLGPADDAASAPPVAVVSYRYWSERLNRDPSVIGSSVRLDRVSVAIVGVAAPEFYGETLEPDPPSFWMPLAINRLIDPSRAIIDSPEIHWLYLLGRLGPATAAPQAQARVTAVLQDWLRARAGASVSSERQARIARARIPLNSGAGGITHARREYSSALQLLLAISSTVLLIACANIANLLLARGAARERERSIRLAIGASRGRLVRQSLTESLTLALAGGALGVLVAMWGVRLLLALVFGGTDTVPFSTSPDGRVLAFAFALSCGAAIVFGVLPAIRGSAGVVARDAGRPGWANALVVAQVALSLVVLAAAGALSRSLANLATQSFGFETERVLVVNVDPARAGYDFKRLGPLYRDMYARLNALPGVKSAAFSYYSPFNECCWGFTIAASGYTPQPGENTRAMLNSVSPGYFETLGTKLLRGRTFDEHDTPASARVAVVNAEFARHFFADADPIGRRFSIGDGGVPGAYEIVGVVESAKYDSPRDRVEPMAFMPLLQRDPDEADTGEDASHHFIRTIEVRAPGNPAIVAGAVRQALAAIDPNLPVLRVDTLSDDVGRALTRESVVASLAVFFGVAALALTCVGLYGLTAWSVQRRTREIGIRIALGARRNAVVGMVVGEVLAQAAIGTLVGVPAAFVALRLIGSALYGVSPVDPTHSAVATIILLGCIMAAGYAPARRASRIEPIEALRHD